MTERTPQVINPEDEPPPDRSGLTMEARLDLLTSNMERMSHQIAELRQVTDIGPIDIDIEEVNQDETSSVFDPTESLAQASNGKSLAEAELPYDDLYNDSDDCGPKVMEGVAKRINSSCTKKPGKEQFTSIQKKYLRPENCEFLKAPRVNPELWDDLQDKTKGREGSFQAFQKNLIKGVIPVIMFTDKVVKAKQDRQEFIPVSDIYDLAVDALTLLGNSVYEFSMRRRELLKSEVAPAYKSLCHESQPITTMLFGDELPQSIRNISQVKRMAAKSVSNKRKFDSKPTPSQRDFKVPRYDGRRARLNYRTPPYRGAQLSVAPRRSGTSKQ